MPRRNVRAAWHAETRRDMLPGTAPPPIDVGFVSQNPRVTAFIPVYNRSAFVGQAIESMLGQTYTDFELVLLDDGSTDDSLEIMRSYSDPRVRVFEHEKNLGLPRTRNRGLELARGEYIALLDSDDVSLPERLACQVAFLDRNPRHAEVGAWSQAMNEAGKPLRKVKIQPTRPEEVRATLLFRCSIKNRSLMGRTALMRELGYRLDFPRCQDYDLHVRLAEKHPIGNIPRVLVLGRQHPGQWTGKTSTLGNTLKMRIMAEQLQRLGLEPDEQDLKRHLLLAYDSADAVGVPIDSVYLEWSEAWLARLREANAATRRYEVGAFDRVLGDIRLLLALRSYKQLGWPPLRRYLAGSLPWGLGSSQNRAALRLALDFARRRAIVAETPAIAGRGARAFAG